MNVGKIRTLSKIHETLKQFHTICVHNDVELTAQIGGRTYGEVTLGSTNTRQIISAVRKATLLEICWLEAAIKEEAEK